MGPVLRAVDPGGTEADEDRALWDSFSGGHQGYKGPSQKHPNGQQEKCTWRLPSTQHEFNEICHSVTFYFMKKRLQTMLWHHNARVNSHQRWKQMRFRVCFHLWCELTSTINVTEWQVSWNSCISVKVMLYSIIHPKGHGRWSCCLLEVATQTTSVGDVTNRINFSLPIQYHPLLIVSMDIWLDHVTPAILCSVTKVSETGRTGYGDHPKVLFGVTNLVTWLGGRKGPTGWLDLRDGQVLTQNINWLV